MCLGRNPGWRVSRDIIEGIGQFLAGVGEVVQVLEVEPEFGGVPKYLPKRGAVAAVMP